jgi:hypothetical protein
MKSSTVAAETTLGAVPKIVTNRAGLGDDVGCMENSAEGMFRGKLHCVEGYGNRRAVTASGIIAL